MYMPVNFFHLFDSFVAIALIALILIVRSFLIFCTPLQRHLHFVSLYNVCDYIIKQITLIFYMYQII